MIKMGFEGDEARRIVGLLVINVALLIITCLSQGTTWATLLALLTVFTLFITISLWFFKIGFRSSNKHPVFGVISGILFFGFAGAMAYLFINVFWK